MTDETGGPAFPNFGVDENKIILFPQGGMSLRDWFAGLAMQALVSSGRYDWGCKAYADESYSMADAMLKVRGGE